MPSSSRRRRYQRRGFPSERRLKALVETEQSLASIKTLQASHVSLANRLCDWLGYPLQKRAFQRLLEEKFEGFPWLANAWEDYRSLEGEQKALRLATKKWPAPEAAAEVRNMGRMRAAAERRAKIAEYLLTYYETLFPWLVEFRSEDVDELLVSHGGVIAQDIKQEDDPARKWLTEAEYEKLPTSQKFQLALDRYWRQRKTKWQVGRDYERYWGYQYESLGFAVRYQGIIEGFEDLGRDLVCIKGPVAEIVQCKYWSKEKTIHEKHVFQLFGTVTAYRLDNPGVDVRGTFVTSTRLSDRASRFAQALGIRVIEESPLLEYPCIKCNVSRRDGVRIYHLPFDQQYDKTLIEEERLERYVATMAEAESLGFRRAFRWRGEG